MLPWTEELLAYPGCGSNSIASDTFKKYGILFHSLSRFTALPSPYSTFLHNCLADSACIQGYRGCYQTTLIENSVPNPNRMSAYVAAVGEDLL